MNKATPDPLSGVAADLAGAIRRARLEEAERSDAAVEIRSAEVARLELLHEAIRPILAQVPEHIDLFDAGVTYGEHPRLYVDMIGFLDVGPDLRTYRLMQDTRHGRILMAESEGLEATIDEVTTYVARRLVEREKALAADTTLEVAAKRYAAATPAGGADPNLPQSQEPIAMTTTDRPIRQRGRRRGWFGRFLRFVIEFLGTVTLLMIFIGAGFMLYHVVRAWLATHYGLAPE